MRGTLRRWDGLTHASSHTQTWGLHLLPSLLCPWKFGRVSELLLRASFSPISRKIEHRLELLCSSPFDMSPSMTPGLSPTSSRFHRVRRQDVAQSPAVGGETSGTEPGNGNGSAGTTTPPAGDGGAGSQPATSTSAPVPETTSPAAQPEGSTTTTTLNPIEATGTTAAATTTVANQFTTTSSVPDQGE